MYTIKVDYKTGNSFKIYDTSTTLDSEWNLLVAKENLRRIKDHHTAYDNKNNYFSMSLHAEGLSITKSIENAPWYYDKDWENYIMLLENDGTCKKYSCEWIGYFESLIGASIVPSKSEADSMSFTV